MDDSTLSGTRMTNKTLKIGLLSFGYKFGVPVDVDLVFDVRFLTESSFCFRL